MKLKDKVAIVTGAGRNIGEETAKLFASEGAKIVVVDMDEGRGHTVTEELNASQAGTAVFVKADVSDEDSVKNLVSLETL